MQEVTAELDKCKQAFTKASQSNSELHKAMDLHIQNLNVLASPLEQIKAALPNPQSVLGMYLFIKHIFIFDRQLKI